MCNIPKQFCGKEPYPHKHDKKTGKITFFVPEAPNKRDVEYVAEMLKNKNIEFIVKAK